MTTTEDPETTTTEPEPLEQELGDPNPTSSTETDPDPLTLRVRRKLRDVRRRTRKALPRWRARAWHWVRLLLALMFRYSWRGVGRLIARASKWVYDYDSATLQHEHAGRGETKEWVAIDARRVRKLRARYMVIVTLTLPVVFPLAAWFAPTYLAWAVAFLVFCWTVKLIPGKEIGEYFVALAVGGMVGWAGMVWFPRIPQPDWTDWRVQAALAILAVATLIGLGVIGRPDGKPLVKPTTLGPNILPRPTAPMIQAALCALGNSKMKEPESIGLIIDGVRNGPGWNFHLLLPQGVTAAWVMGRREELAGSMRFPLGCVWPSVGRNNPAHLVLDVTDDDLKDTDQEEWPLLRAKSVDLGQRQPAGTNQKGDWVTVQMAYASVIIGAVPRIGKTYFLRQLLLTAGLDPSARVYAIDGKGTGDLSPCALYAHRYVRGVRSTRPELIERVREMIRELRHEMDRRADVIDSFSHEECPQSKVTSDLIKRYPGKRLGWIVVGIDETQMLFGYGDVSNTDHKAIRQELRAGITELVKLGPALGIIVILATQDVVEETIPTQISRMAVVRMCMKVEDHNPNDRVLGTGAYKRGIDATMFSQDDLGIGWLKSEGATPQIVRTVWGLDKPEAEVLAARGRALRVAAGNLTGDAAGDIAEIEAEEVELLADARAVVDADGGRSTSLQRLAALLAEHRATWKDLDAEAVGGLLRTAGVAPSSIYCPAESRSMQGVRREQLDVSTTERWGDGDDPETSAT